MIISTLRIFTILYISLTQKCTATTQNFVELTKQPFFVDKTEFIGTFFEEYNKHIFITAPRGFGKTTNLQMLRLFAEIELDSNHKPKPYIATNAYQIFQRLKISNYSYMIEKHLAQQVVIYIDLESDDTMATSINLNKTVKFFNTKLHQSFEPYKWLLDKPKEDHKITAQQIQLLENLNANTLPEGDESNIKTTLYDLANILHIYFEKDVMILIDNYDSVLNSFLKPTKKDIDTFYQYLSTVLCNTFDNNHTVTSYGLIQGTSSLALAHILQTLSKSKHYNFLTDHSYTAYYGFTDPEATNLLIKYNCSIRLRQQVRKLYNGYKSKTKMLAIYNPASMIKYLSKVNNSNALIPYWNITAKDNNFLLSFKGEKVLSHLLQNLLRNITAKFEQYESYSLQNFTLFFDKCVDHDYKVAEVEMLFSYFFDQGYLTHGINQIIHPDARNVEDTLVHMFTTPNLEIWTSLKELSACLVDNDTLRLPNNIDEQNTNITVPEGEKPDPNEPHITPPATN